MKKAIFLTLATVMAFAGCSKEDTNTPVGPDPIVGTWYLIEHKQVENGEVTTFSLSACDKKGNYEIKRDGTLLSTYYSKDINGECSSNGTETVEWIKKEDGVYTFNYINDDDERISAEVLMEKGTLKIVFIRIHNGVEKQSIEIYSRTPDKSGDDVVQDQIIGKWKHTDLIILKNGKQIEVEFPYDCLNKNMLEFVIDGSGVANLHYVNKQEECTPVPQTFTWTNIGNVNYRMQFIGGKEFKITFDNNTMEKSRTFMSNGSEFKVIDFYISLD